MRETSSTIRNMEKECLRGLVEISTKETLLMIRGRETARCFGLMEACMKESGVTVFSTESEELCFLTACSRKATLKITSTSTL